MHLKFVTRSRGNARILGATVQLSNNNNNNSRHIQI